MVHTSFATMLDKMNELGMVSVYHHKHRRAHGGEKYKTFRMQRKGNLFHLDYIFAPRSWLEKPYWFHLGALTEWLQYSDHCPLVAEFMKKPGILWRLRHQF